MEMTWLQQRPASRDAAATRKVAEQLRTALDTAEVKGALTAIPAIGGTSHQVDAVVQPYAELLGFSSQKTTLFTDYPVALRPDWYRPLGHSILLFFLHLMFYCKKEYTNIRLVYSNWHPWVVWPDVFHPGISILECSITAHSPPFLCSQATNASIFFLSFAK